MTNSTAHERVRSALAAVVAGNSPPRAFESFIAEMIAERALTPNDARVELEAAVRDGTLPPDSLRRLGFGLGFDKATATQPYLGAARSDDAVQRSTDQTQVRVFTAPPLKAQGEPAKEDAESARAEPSPANTNAVWIEPDSVAGSPRVGTGTVLGNRYRLEYKLGEGGMGVVYRATDLEVKGETFAIKVLKPAIRERPESLHVMREEVRKTRALRHPNIVGVYSLNSDPAGVYILMECLEGKSVSALIDEDFGRGMPMMRAWPLIHDIGSALAYAHDHNVIHSDLKPSNLFVTVSGKAMLLDFGIARAARTRSGRFDTGTLGALTPAYASSEMLSGHAPDQTDDVYAFACVIYEMLSGRHPFNGLSALDAQKAGMCPAPLATLTQRQNQALVQALAFERVQRTRSVENLLAGLEPRAEPQQWSLSKVPPKWVAAAGVCICLAAGVATWVMLRKPSAEHTRTAALPTAPAVPRPEPVAPLAAAPAAIIATPTQSSTHAAAAPQPEAPPTSPIAAVAPAPGASPTASRTAVAVSAPGASLTASRTAAATQAPDPPPPASRTTAAIPAPAAPPATERAAPLDPIPSSAAQTPARHDGAAGKLPEPVPPKTQRDATVSAMGPLRPEEQQAVSAANAGPLVPAGAAASAPAALPAARTRPRAAVETETAGAGPTTETTGTARTEAEVAGRGVTSGPARSAGLGEPAMAGTTAGVSADGATAASRTGPTAATAAVTAALSAPSTSAAVPVPPARLTPADVPPSGKKFPSIIPLPESDAQLNSCPYPEEARRQVETGTVVLLVHVAPDGTVANSQVETSSGSASLDEGAVSCVKQYGQFAQKIVGKPSAGYWGRMRFNWSFGG